jgi:hypothetical protein
MLAEKKNSLQSYPSLLPLQMALIVAERESPATPPRIQADVNEQLAMQLIENLKAEYKKPLLFLDWNDIPSQHGLYESVQGIAVIPV